MCGDGMAGPPAVGYGAEAPVAAGGAVVGPFCWFWGKKRPGA